MQKLPNPLLNTHQ